MGPLIVAQVQIHERTSTCESRNGFCPRWIADHIGDYGGPLARHAELVVASVAIGFALAFALAVLAYRRRWLIGPITGVTGVLYTIPSVALFTVLLPITGFGFRTALIALSSYTLLIIFRNVIAGLDNVPADARDAARGMGLTARQLLWRVEIPLALPEIMAGLRIATTTTVGLAALAFLAGAGGLGAKIETDITFKSNIVVAGGLCVLLAIAFDAILLGAERLMTPWRRANR
jgi:osmoprotectant transport system permease protein